MNTFVKKIKNNLFLTLIIFIYLILLISLPKKGIESFNNSLYYIKEMLTIMPVILLLTALVEAWIPKNTIQSALGEGSGIKGFAFSFLLGSFSAGPIYAAFPICKMLIKKGASIANIIIILSAWAVIKIPMLVNESKFLGPKFMAIRWILTTISILIIAIASSKIIKKKDIPLDNSMPNDNAVLKINESFCIGCGLCTKIAIDNFVMENKKGTVLGIFLKSEETEKIKLAIDKCPAKAIEYSSSERK